jgi:hypothetical protein
MLRAPSSCTLCFFVAALAPLLAQAQGSGCTASSGSRFNLEPRANAVVQVSQSVAFLPNRAGKHNIDLLVSTASDARGLDTNPNPTIASADAFYVQRSAPNCTPDFEGAEVLISNPINTFGPFGNPTVVADPAHDGFYIVDLRFATQPDENGVGIIHSSASTLLNKSSCPDGTLVGTALCWPLGAVINITDLNSFLANPEIAVDPRTSGKGAGDVYTVVSQRDSGNNTTSIMLTACTSGMNCGSSISVSASDAQADFSWIQVRPDGKITITYRNTTFPGINPEDIKFVTCTPNGAPNPPTCAKPTLVTTEKAPVFAAFIGNVNLRDVLFPKHVNRLEADGHTVITFLVYDRCAVPVIPQFGADQAFCPRTEVVTASSPDGGATWSPVSVVSSAKGQQFFGTLADDASTGTINIAYYSTENDAFFQHPQVFLAQIAPGATTVSSSHQLTADFADVQATSPLSFVLQPQGFGDRIGVAAAGTGKAGQSRAYVTYTWNTVQGTYNGVPSADVNNHVILFQY